MWNTSTVLEDSVALEVEAEVCEGHECVVNTSFGQVSVVICGDGAKPALITYPDIGLDYSACFNGLFACTEAASLLYGSFCVYHINAPGHEPGASSLATFLNMDNLADQIAEILDHFELQEVLCMGVTAGAYILSLFATRYWERVAGLILVTPLCRSPSWTEWFCNKLMANLLYFCGMCGVVKEILLRRYFSQVFRDYDELGITQVYAKHLDGRNSQNVLQLLQAVHMRRDLSCDLKKLKCRTLVFVGEHSVFHEEALHLTGVMDRRYIALVEVTECGSLVTKEMPGAMLVPLQCFLMGFGLYRPIQVAKCHQFSSPTGPLSPPCISAELLSPESLGIKLKPIKTRVVIDD